MKNAIVLRKRGINHGPVNHPEGSIIRDMHEEQFADWSSAGLVREATEKEVAAADKKATDQPSAAPIGMARTQLSGDEAAEVAAAQAAAAEAAEPEKAPAKSKPKG